MALFCACFGPLLQRLLGYPFGGFFLPLLGRLCAGLLCCLLGPRFGALFSRLFGALFCRLLGGLFGGLFSGPFGGLFSGFLRGFLGRFGSALFLRRRPIAR